MTNSEASSADALHGLRVVNLSSTLGGALVGQFFADYGAEVVLVEPPDGSPLRTQAGWPIWARGSKSLKATLDDPAVQALARRADVLIDTFRPGVLERHGLGHEQLAEENPRLVTTAITAFGRKGPYANRKGYEGVVMAKIGAYDQLATLVSRDGPAFVPVPFCTLSAAQLAFAGALAGLYEREKSGVGQRVDTTLVQAIAAHDTWNWMVAHWARKYPDAFAAAPIVNTLRKVPNSWLSYALLQGLSKDGRWLQFSESTPRQFRAFLKVCGMDGPEWEDAWEDENLDRRIGFWEGMLAAVRARTVAEWQEVFDTDPAIFAEVFRSGSELLRHPQLLFDDHVATTRVPGLGEVRMPKPFVRLSKTPGSAMRPPPGLDEHGEALRREAESAGPAPAAPVSPSPSLPLEGVTIVELGSFYAAPFGITMLTDLGARVLKIEPPDGDPIRFQLPMPELGGVKVTQGKQSLAVDIRMPEGVAIVGKLLESADAVLVSFRAGVAERLGLGEAAARAIKADIIYHQGPGFGVAGPYGHRPAYAPTIGAGSGLARRNLQGLAPEGPDLTVEEVKDGALRLSTASSAVGHSDGFSALGVCCGQLLALLARARGAGGQGVITTMLTTLAQILSEDVVEYEGRPAAPAVDAEMLGLGPLYRLYETKAGWIFLAAPNEDEWDALRGALPGAGLDDPRFADAQGRAESGELLAERLSVAFAERTAAEWEQTLIAADLACAEVVAGPSHEALMAPGGLLPRLGMTTEVDHPLFERHMRLQSVMQFSRSATRAGPGALIGQHTEEVLREYGYSVEQIADLNARGVIGLN